MPHDLGAKIRHSEFNYSFETSVRETGEAERRIVPMGLWKRHPEVRVEPWNCLVDAMMDQEQKLGMEANLVGDATRHRRCRYLIAQRRKVRQPWGEQAAGWM